MKKINKKHLHELKRRRKKKLLRRLYSFAHARPHFIPKDPTWSFPDFDRFKKIAITGEDGLTTSASSI